MNIKHISTTALLAGIMALPIMTSCGDNENFSVDHVLTPDELAEMRRQDSIAEVLRNTINADWYSPTTANSTSRRAVMMARLSMSRLTRLPNSSASPTSK